MHKQSIPKPFIDKIQIDKGLSKFRRDKVLPFEQGKKLVLLQQTFRYRCQEFLKRKSQGNAA